MKQVVFLKILFILSLTVFISKLKNLSRNFCNWLKKLPGEDRTVNNCSELEVKQMFNVEDAKNQHDQNNIQRDHIHKLWAKVSMSIKLSNFRFTYGA